MYLRTTFAFFIFVTTTSGPVAAILVLLLSAGRVCANGLPWLPFADACARVLPKVPPRRPLAGDNAADDVMSKSAMMDGPFYEVDCIIFCVFSLPRDSNNFSKSNFSSSSQSL